MSKIEEQLKQKLSLDEQPVKENISGAEMPLHSDEALTTSPCETPTPDELSANSKSQRVHSSKAKEKKSKSDLKTESDGDDKDCEPLNDDHIQNFEWQDYLQRSMEEVINDDLSCLLRPPLVKVATAPLLRRTASPKVLNSVACLLMLPFVTETKPNSHLKSLLEAYAESNVVDQLIQGIWNLLAEKQSDLNKVNVFVSKDCSV